MRHTIVVKAFLLLTTLGALGSAQEDDEFLYDTFPEGFKWGFATASYQIEGAYDIDGKGPNIWDNYTHQSPSPIDDNSTGDVACNSYYMYREDVELLKTMGSDYYRFSLSWSRILPTGRIDNINQLGIDYYNRLINLLIENNVEPMITLYHWDLPQGLQDLGGWPNEALIEHFTAFADLAYKTFGDRVKQWITFNEPWVVCYQGYGNGGKAPGILDATQPYQCTHTILKAHAKAYRLYESTYKPVQQGRVGITLDCGWYEPANASDPTHVAAAERALQFKHGWYGSPIYFGKYPDVMREFVDTASVSEGVPSRLPQFTANESNELRGSWDFVGLNHYTTALTEPMVDAEPGWLGDQDIRTYADPSWPTSSATWLQTVPWGMRKILNWLKNTYNNPEIYVTENGFADYPDSGVVDVDRMFYYNNYINQMLKAVKLDGVNCTVYTAWSLLDNFEWQRGYTQRFGTHYVDFTDPARPRFPKASAGLLKQIFADNGFPKP